MASIMDMLLSADPQKLTERPKAKLKMKRLEKLLGGDCEFEIKALTASEIDELRSREKEHMIVEAVTNVDFGDQRLCTALRPEGRSTPLTPVEAVRKLLPDAQSASQINADMKYWAANRDAIGSRWYAWQAK